MKHIQQEMSSKSMFYHLWKCLLPLAFYLTVNIFVMMLAMLVIFLLRISPGLSPEELTKKYGLIIMGFSAAATVFLFVKLMPRFPEYRLSDMPVQERGWIAKAVLFLAAGACTAAFLNLTAGLVMSTAVPEAYMETEEILYGGSVALQILVNGILIAIAEELVFRGAIFHYLLRTVGATVAIIGSALLFGLYHGNTVQFVYGSIMGCLLAWAVEKSGDLTASILMHMAANLTIILMEAFDVFGWIYGSRTVIIVAVLTGGALSLGCIYGIHRLK